MWRAMITYALKGHKNDIKQVHKTRNMKMII